MSTVEEVIRAQPGVCRLCRWKSIAGVACSAILGLLFLASGIWKLTDLDASTERMVQSLVPVALSVPAALAVAIYETFAGVLLLIPRYRRWGAWIAGVMLAAFMVYIGVLYNRLLGEDCNCSPWIRRVLGPAFFAGDAAMLALAGIAGWWSDKSQGRRRAVAILCCVSQETTGCLPRGRGTPEFPPVLTATCPAVSGSQEMSVPFLGRIPIDPRIVGCGDAGSCFLDAHPESPAAGSYLSLSGRLHEQEDLWRGTAAATAVTSREVT